MSRVALNRSLASSENLRWPLVLPEQWQYCVLCMHRRKCLACRVSAVAVAYNHFKLIFSWRESGPILFPQLLYQTTMLHAPTWASCEVSRTRESNATTESPMDSHCNENKQRTMEQNWVKSSGESLEYFPSWTEWAEIRSLKPAASATRPAARWFSVIQDKKPKLFRSQPEHFRTIKWFKMAQPCYYTLNQSDGNKSASRISNDTSAKSLAGLPEANPLFKSAWWHFHM